MPSATFVVPVASATVGADMFKVGSGLGVSQAQKGNGVPRRLHAIGITGSANPGDFGIDLFAGGKYLGSFVNTTGGANITPANDKDMQPIFSEDYIAAGADLLAVCNDAGVTNPLWFTIAWEDKIAGKFSTDIVQQAGMRKSSYSAPRRAYRRSSYSKRRSR